VKSWKGKLARLALVLLISWGALEALLRLTAPYLGPQVCTELVRSYSYERDGIYYLEPMTRMNFMHANADRRMAVNGFQWVHQSDARGFRNPPGADHDILIFGDSFLYGHGVNEAETAVAQLRQRYGWKVYNMARQGDSIWQQYILFRLYFDELKPRHIILCPFGNDFHDIQTARSPQDELDPPELKPDFMGIVRYNMQDPLVHRPMGNWFTSSYCYRLISMFARRLQHRGDFKPPTDPARQESEFAGAGHYYSLLFEDMLARCRSTGCTMDMVYVDTATNIAYWGEEQARLDPFFRQLCARNQVPYYSTRELLKDHPEYELPRDGHLNPLGNEKLADFMARECPKTWRKD